MYSQTDYLVMSRQPSRWLAVLLLASSLLACLAVYQSALSLLPRILCVLLVCSYALWIWPRQISLQHPHSVTGLRFDSDGWHILRRDGSEAAAQLLADTYVSALLTVVRLREQGRWRAVLVVLASDAASEESLRRLRLRLRFSRQRWAVVE
ncbi:MAG TPA: hypothetical protein ENH72_01015 [Pseudomonas sabulinigri]|uniref:Toxin CptA n=1 Tax=marine sediment metagenome TaxID=412755 RepID=A0A0F9UPA2_9ZZZZ|nr:hypothetical protein [Halopseudomonas sabulinigri]HEC51379.1 hypothetical protein [Halopseudomonas sabulinigri]